MTAKQLAEKISRLAWNKKGEDIVIMDLRKISDMADFFVIISGESDMHVRALSDHIQEQLEEEKIKVWHREGYQYLNWVLLDYIDVVVHIFKSDVREHYNLERLWADAKKLRVEEKVRENVADRIVFKEAN